MSVNYTVTTGDRIYTDQGSRAEVEVGPYAVRLSETTDVMMANLNNQVMQLGMAQGTIRVTVFQFSSGNTVEIDTPNGALTLMEPGSYRVDVDPNNGFTLVTVNRGSLQVSGGGTDQTVGSGQAVQLTGSGPIQVSSVELPSADDFDQWSMSRDRRLESATSARYVSRYAPGYEDLDAYGSWQDVPEYGPVWYPSGVAPGWVPYRFGQWVWVEPWGWTWVEDEPWGFCPFHYGRWAFIGSAWGWVPGPVAVAPVYAPALVAFIGGSGFSFGLGLGVEAWFPLGPGELFFPWYHYGSDYLRQVNVTNVRNVTNITNITNVTNVNNIRYVNRSVATTAVPAAAFRSGQPVASQVVHIDPQQIAKAPVIPHPSVSPTVQAAVGGKPVSAPRIHAPRVAAPVTAQNQRAPNPSAGRTSQPPLVTRNTPPVTRNPAPQSAPSGARLARVPQPITNPSAERGSAGGPPSAPPHLITKSPPPSRNVPFERRQPAMSEHPGRPLEPQQTENLRAGKPPGPMRDREVPPHREGYQARSSVPEQPASRPSNQQKPTPRREDRKQ